MYFTRMVKIHLSYKFDVDVAFPKDVEYAWCMYLPYM